MSAASSTTERGPKTTLRDVAIHSDLKLERAASTEAWDAALAAYVTAKAETDAAPARTPHKDLYDRESAAQEAVLLTPAPHIEAVSIKLSFIGEFKDLAQGDFLTPEIARRMVARGNNWTDRCLAAAFLDLDRMKLPPSPARSNPAWDAAVAAFEAAEAEEARLMDALGAASEAIERDAPTPDILKREDGGRYITEGQIEAANLPFDQKVAMVSALRAWEPERAAAAATHRLVERNEEWSDHSVAPAEDALVQTPAPNAAALALKLGLVISRHVGVALADLQTAEQVSRLLTSPESVERDLVVAYQDALSLAGLRPDLVAAQAFDVEAWIDAFEAHPGHMVGAEGRLSYLEPKAYGADTPDYKDIMVTEPDAIARFDAYQRRHYTDEQWEEKQAERKNMGWRPLNQGAPFIVEDLAQLDAAYPEGGPEYDRLKAMFDLRAERLRSGSPTGAPLWRALAPWQQQAVRDFCRSWPTQFTDNYRWTAERWMAAFEDAGGSYHLHPDGSSYIGHALPAPYFADRLMRALEGDLQLAVEADLRGRWEREACNYINEYHEAGGHICLTFNPYTGEDTGLCVRIAAAPSERATLIEGLIQGPWRRHFITVLKNSYRFATAELARGDFSTSKAAVRVAERHNPEAGR